MKRAGSAIPFRLPGLCPGPRPQPSAAMRFRDGSFVILMECELTERDVKLTVRLTELEHAELRARAFSSRLPVAVFIRQSALQGAPVKAAPPVPDQQPEPCRKLLHVCMASVSNLTQLHAHASAAGEPLNRVCPLLLTMQDQIRALGLSVKNGEMDEARASEILGAGLLAASDQMNELSNALNEGQTALNSTWRTVLADLRTALEEVSK